MKEITTDRIVIVGAGLGALYAALKLAPRPVVMISPEVLGEGASSAWAQGGVAAAMDPTDDPKNHAADTVKAGAGTVDAAVADLVTRHARDYILDLTRMGAPFDRTDDGGYVLSREAAHSFARVVRVKGDQAGAEIMKALIEQVRDTPSIQVLEGTMATGLDTKDGVVTGIAIQDSDTGRSAPIMLRGAAYLLAGGGSGGLYAITTNPPRIRGQVIGMAARAGAMITDAEFVQFHPTAMDVGEDPAPLAMENGSCKPFIPTPNLPRAMSWRGRFFRNGKQACARCWTPVMLWARGLKPNFLPWPRPARAMVLILRLSPFLSPLRPITIWGASRQIPMGGPALAGFGSAVKRRQQGCTGRTGWPRTAC
jgi:hypothetical protein